MANVFLKGNKVRGVVQTLAEVKINEKKGYVMELLGPDLLKVLNTARENNNKIKDPPAAPVRTTYTLLLFYLHSILTTLEQLHKLRYVHADIKSENILTIPSAPAESDKTSIFKLADFGHTHRKNEGPEGMKTTIYYAPWEHFASPTTFSHHKFIHDIESSLLVAIHMYYGPVKDCHFSDEECYPTPFHLNKKHRNIEAVEKSEKMCKGWSDSKFEDLCMKLFGSIYGDSMKEKDDDLPYGEWRKWVREALLKVEEVRQDTELRELLKEMQNNEKLEHIPSRFEWKEWLKNFDLPQQKPYAGYEATGSHQDENKTEILHSEKISTRLRIHQTAIGE